MNERETLKVNKDGILEIGGIDVKTLKEKYGTPLYIIDQAHVENMCGIFSETLKKEYGNGLIAYASKAFCCKEIYRIMYSLGMGADAVSGGELYTAKSAGFPMEKIIFHGNNKTNEELEMAVDYRAGLIVIDSFSEADKLNIIAEKKDTVQSVLIRVNPGIEAHTHHYIQTAKTDSKFGFSISDGQAEQIIDYVQAKKSLRLKGLHCHIGSQIFENKSFILAVEKMTDFYKKLSDEKGIAFDILNLGGGFGIWYTDSDRKLSCSQYADYIKDISSALINCCKRKNITKPYLILEPGRSIIGEAGITLYSAGNVKEIKGVKNYVSVDGGMFDNPRFALYQAKYTVEAAERMNAEKTKLYTVAGKCCESGDIIAEDCLLPVINEGEILAVFSTGAYNYSMASNYNRNRIPPVVMVKNGESRYAVKPQTYDDLLRNDV